MNPFDAIKNLQNMTETLQNMESKVKEITASGTAGASAVTIVLNGKFEMQDIKIDKEMFEDVEDLEALPMLIKLAHNNAVENVSEKLKSQTSSLASDIGLSFNQ